jgi:glycosyltransferase involved in cell wall biosynthesis
LREDLVRRGREQAAQFSWERTARQMLEIYEEAVAR